MIRLSGVVTEIKEEYEVSGITYRDFTVSVARASGVSDMIPVRCKMPFDNFPATGDRVTVVGDIRTYKSEGFYSTRLYVYCKEITSDYTLGLNEVDYIVNIFSSSKCRQTPSGRKIIDLFLGYPKYNNTYATMQAIAWGKTAESIEELSKNTAIEIKGRLQSRTYVKKFDDGTSRECITYEVSISSYKEV